MHAYQGYNACMDRIQYTIRGVPERLDKAMRRRASREGKSLNEAVLEALNAGAGLSETPVRYSDLDDLAGSWVSDPEFDRAIEEMDRIDPELWR